MLYSVPHMDNPKRAMHLALWAFLVFFQLASFALLFGYQIFHSLVWYLREDLELCAFG